MNNAVKEGYQTNINQPIFIVKIFHEGEWKVGKVISPLHVYKGIWVWTSVGGTNTLMEFQLLKYNYTLIAEDGSVLYAN